jgi:hypothetical protein
VEALLAFGAALIALRLGARLASRWRATHRPEVAAWAAGLVAYALAAAAMAAGAAAGWNEGLFRAYYLFGGLLTAALLGLGSLLLTGARWALAPALVYTGLAIGVALAAPIEGEIGGTSIPEAQDHLAFVPARLVAILGNSLGALAVIAVAIATIRRRPLGNVLIVTGVAVAALGSALAGLGAAESAIFVLIAALLLYGGFTAKPRSNPQSTATVST